MRLSGFRRQTHKRGLIMDDLSAGGKGGGVNSVWYDFDSSHSVAGSGDRAGQIDATTKVQNTDHPRPIDRAQFLRGIAALGIGTFGMGAFSLMPATKVVAREVVDNAWIDGALSRGEPVLLEVPPKEYAVDLRRTIDLKPASLLASIQQGTRAFIRLVGDPTMGLDTLIRGSMASDATVRDLQIAGFIPDGMDRHEGTVLLNTNGKDARTLLSGLVAANIGVTDWPGSGIFAMHIYSCQFLNLDIQRTLKGGLVLRGVSRNTTIKNVKVMTGVENQGTYGDDAFAHVRPSATRQGIVPSMGNVMEDCTFYRAITPGFLPGGVAGRFSGSSGGTADNPTWLVRNTTFAGGNGRRDVCTLTIRTHEGHGPRHLVFENITVDPMGQTGGIKLDAEGYAEASQQPQDITISVARMGEVASGRSQVEIDPLIDPVKNRIQIWIEGERVI
jgi:hypothetical protein